MLREFGHSTISVTVISATNIGIYAIVLYWGFAIYNPYAVQSGLLGNLLYFMAIMLAHDTYFYWTHRAMHLKGLFVPFHRLHHKSNNPSPWSAYSFSLLESIVQGAFFPIYLTYVPTPLPALIAFGFVQISFNVIGHGGIELAPRWSVIRLKFLTGVTFHDLHHAYYNCNYGLYFRFWDRLMGSEHPRFEAAYLHVISKENKGDLHSNFLKNKISP
ncbi:MAG: sterol desaturase family protein [Novosphingobium sp.]